MIEMKGFYSLEKPGDFHNLVDVQVLHLATGILSTKIVKIKIINIFTVHVCDDPPRGREE